MKKNVFYLFSVFIILVAPLISGCVSLDKKNFEFPVDAPIVLYPSANDIKGSQLKDVVVQTETTIKDISLDTRLIRDVSLKANNAVVSIYTKTETPYRVRLQPFRIPGTGFRVKLPGESLGSGFFIHPSGYLLTNNHVIEDSVHIQVQTKEGHDYPVTIIARDPTFDLALLKVERATQKFPVLPMGNSDTIGVGDFAIAAGNPLGLGHTVTFGIISQTGRSLARVSEEKGRHIDFIQTDTAINSGSSGGPLITLTGACIGVNTAKALGAQGIGFAVPSNQAMMFLRDVIAGKGILAAEAD